MTTKINHPPYIRLATCGSGEQYIVSSMRIPLDPAETQKVVTLGEVEEVSGLRVTHGPHITWLRSAVEITEVKLTPKLARTLFRQWMRLQIEDGLDVVVSATKRGLRGRIVPAA